MASKKKNYIKKQTTNGDKMLTKTQEKSIVTYLKDNFKMPTKGFVAGQAVASLIYKELSLNLNEPINDVDVFVKREDGANPFAQCRKEFFGNMVSHEYRGSGGEFAFSSTYNRFYQIVRSFYKEDDENVNIVEFSSTTHNPNQKIIDSFDFNCCSVGFDIETEMFYFSTGFIDFVKTKQLRVQSVHTPFHSWLRLNKKIQDLGENIFCDVNLERFVLIQSMNLNYKEKSSFIVGERFIELMNKYKDDEFLKMISNDKATGLDLENHECEKLKKTYKTISLNESYLTSRYYLENINRLPNKTSDKIFKLKKETTDNSDTSMNTEFFFWGCNSVSATNLIHLMHETGLYNQKYIKKIGNFFERTNYSRVAYVLITSLLEETPLSKMKGDLPLKQIQRISRLLKDHPAVINAIKAVKNDEMSFKDILDAFERIGKEVKLNPEKMFFLGLVETKVPLKDILDCLHLSPIEASKKIIKNGDQDFIKKKLIFKNNNFSLFGAKIKQLETVIDFYNAGKESQNCIFGYFNSWAFDDENEYKSNENSASRFFTIKYKGKTSCIYLEDDKIYQHYGIRNSRITNQERFIGECLSFYLCKNKSEKLSRIMKSTFFGGVNKIIRFTNEKLNTKFKQKKYLDVRGYSCGFEDEIPF